MFKRSFTASRDHKPGMKARKITKRSFREDTTATLKERLHAAALGPLTPDASPSLASSSPKLNSSIITIAVGPAARLFAAHEDVLSRSPWFADAVRDQFFAASAGQKRITLADEEPEVVSAVLEWLYKGDYTPRLVHDRKRGTWSLEDSDGDALMTPRSFVPEASAAKKVMSDHAVVYHHATGDFLLRDTLIYCLALRLRLPDLQRLALRKQGLQSGIDVATILRSARFAYAHTPASDSRLRAHYLALIIRSRRTFKRSGTMQMEMEAGGSQLFFDLFVAMANHIDDLAEAQGSAYSSPALTK